MTGALVFCGVFSLTFVFCGAFSLVGWAAQYTPAGTTWAEYHAQREAEHARRVADIRRDLRLMEPEELDGLRALARSTWVEPAMQDALKEEESR